MRLVHVTRVAPPDGRGLEETDTCSLRAFQQGRRVAASDLLGNDDIDTTTSPRVRSTRRGCSVWQLRFLRPTTLRVLPDACMDIINGDVIGSLTTVIVADLKAGDESFGVRLRPGAFTTLYGVPAEELTNVTIPLRELVRKAPSLRAAAADADRPDPVADAAMYQPNLKTLSRDSGYSERHLRRRLLAATGHSPRKLARIGRMQALLAAGRATTGHELCRVRLLLRVAHDQRTSERSPTRRHRSCSPDGR